MRVQKKQKTFEILFSPQEANLLRGCLIHLQSAYILPPGELPPGVETAWYQSAGTEPELREEWQEELRGFRGGHAERIQKWLHDLETSASKLVLNEEDVDAFLTILNDHRLYRCAEFGVTEADMATELEKIKDVDRRIALLEVHFLAWLIELLLRETGI